MSLTLTRAAGGMAISYWILLGELDAFWMSTNLLLVVWPLFFLPGLVHRVAAGHGPLPSQRSAPGES